MRVCQSVQRRRPGAQIDPQELIRGIRLIAAEHEATHLYMAHAEATDHPLAKKVLIDIANEERVHIGEFERLLQILTGDEDDFYAEGRAEVDEIAEEISGGGEDGGDRPERDGPTIGSLRGA